MSGFVLSSCGVTQNNQGLKPKTAAEQQAIHNSWFPVKSKDCQLIVDSFALVKAAIGDASDQNLLNNINQINQNLKSAGKVTSTALLNLANTTDEPTIRSWALKAVPIFANIGNIGSENSNQSNDQILSFMSDLSKLVEDVPSACSS